MVQLTRERRALCAKLAVMQANLERMPAAAAEPSAPATAAAACSAAVSADLLLQLERAQLEDTGISRVLRSDDHDAIAAALQENMVRGWSSSPAGL